MEKQNSSILSERVARLCTKWVSNCSVLLAMQQEEAIRYLVIKVQRFTGCFDYKAGINQFFAMIAEFKAFKAS